MDKLKCIHKAIINHDTSEKTIRLLTALKSDTELLPAYKVPISVLAVVAFDVLGIEKYQGTDDDVQLWKDNLLDTQVPRKS